MSVTKQMGPFQHPPAVRGVYGYRPDLGPFRDRTPEEAARLLDTWKVNTVFATSLEAGYAERLARAGIAVYLDVVCFQGESHWRAHPESRPVDAEGRPIVKEGWYAGVCPSQGWLREQIVRKARRYARMEGVRGVWLDFIRYPVHWEVPKPRIREYCFCPACLGRFRVETGIEIPPSRGTTGEKAAWILENHREAWVSWKCANVAGLVREVRQAVKAANPDCLLGLFTVPWRPGEGGRAVAGQDYALLARWADVFSPMVYHPLVGRPPAWAAEIIAWAGKTTGRPIWPILFAGDREHPVTTEEMRQTMALAGKSGAEGILLLSLGSLLESGLAAEAFSLSP